MMRGLTPRQMLGVKIAASTAVVLFADRLSGRHRAAAIAVMIAGNSALAVVAANNYRLARR